MGSDSGSDSNSDSDGSDSDSADDILEEPTLNEKEVLFPTEEEAVALVGKEEKPRKRIIEVQKKSIVTAVKRKGNVKTVVSVRLMCFRHAANGDVQVHLQGLNRRHLERDS